MRKIFILISILIVSEVYSQEKIQWKKVQIPYNYLLELDLKKNSDCKDKVDKLIEKTLEKNPSKNLNELWAENYLEIPRCVEKELDLYIGKRKNKEKIIDNTPVIKEWYQLKVDKNFILSTYLDKNNCSLIWEKQIPLFKKRNSSINNVNKIEEGSEITIQKCEKISLIKDQDKKERIAEKSIEEVKRYAWMIYLSSFKKNQESYQTGGGINLNLELLDFVEYRMDLMYLDHLFLFNKFLIPLIKTQKESIMLGNNFVNNFDEKSYSFLFLSYKRKFNKSYNLTFDIGTNFSSGANYLRTEISYKRLGVFYQFFEERNILENNLNPNRYNMIGLGFKF